MRVGGTGLKVSSTFLLISDATENIVVLACSHRIQKRQDLSTRLKRDELYTQTVERLSSEVTLVQEADRTSSYISQ